MANGEPIGEVIDRIEGHILRVEKKVDDVMNQGCAHRPDDLRRIDNLEQWRDRGIVGTLTLAAAIAAKWIRG